MATKVPNTPPPAKSKYTLSTGVSSVDELQYKYEKNKKVINAFAIGILLGVVAFFGYRFYQSSQNEKAATAISYPQRYFEMDSMSTALNGDGRRSGFLKIIKKFSGTETANLAQYYAGICYLKQGDFKNAIKHLEEFDGKGTLVALAAKGSLGDAYMDAGQAGKAVSAYEKATADKNDIALTPIYLQRLAMAYEAAGNKEDAAKSYRRIRDDYPQSQGARDVDKYLARLGILD